MTIGLSLCIILLLIVIHTIWPQLVFDPLYDKIETYDILNSKSDISLETGDILFFKNCTRCKCNDSIVNNIFQTTMKNTFNSFRWYVMGLCDYTHVAIIIKLEVDGITKPYICHIDGGRPMYDILRKRYIHRESLVVCDLNHINVRGGLIHLYKYKGPEIKKDMMDWVLINREIKYPSNIHDLITVNAFKWYKHPTGIMACTDLVENTLIYIDIIKNKNATGNYTMNDALDFVSNSHLYEGPLGIKNNCYDNMHF